MIFKHFTRISFLNTLFTAIFLFPNFQNHLYHALRNILVRAISEIPTVNSPVSTDTEAVVDNGELYLKPPPKDTDINLKQFDATPFIRFVFHFSPYHLHVNRLQFHYPEIFINLHYGK